MSSVILNQVILTLGRGHWCRATIIVSSGAPIRGCHIDGLVQDKRNSSALAMGLHLFCTNPSIWSVKYWWSRQYFCCFCFLFFQPVQHFLRQAWAKRRITGPLHNTMMSHDISNHWQQECLFRVTATNSAKIRSTGQIWIHRWPVDSTTQLKVRSIVYQCTTYLLLY